MAMMVRGFLADRWHGDGGYRELLKIAFPLIVSTGLWSVQFFVDRMFLTWYSGAAAAASMQGGVLAFTVAVLFSSTALYCNTFVAQYVGAGHPERVGTAVWQAVFFSIASGVVLFAFSFLGGPIFQLVGHSPEVQALETTYFGIVVGGTGFMVLGSALASFFTGRGDTVTVMLVTVLSVAINIVLNYLWIFGHGGFPEMGIRGAAWATVVSYAVRAFAYFLLVMRRKFRRQFRTLSGCFFDKKLFLRLMRFGIPSGLTSMLDVLVWSLFLFLIGRLGNTQNIATAIAFSINSLAFMPMMGIGIALSTLVGQRQGQQNPALAARSTWSATHLTTLYMGVLAALYVLIPRVFLAPFAANADPEEFRAYAPVVVALLKFVAVYTVFDGFNIIFFSALKGAGDTRFPLAASTSLSWAVLVIPAWGLYFAGHRSVYLIWALATGYIVLLAFALLLRFIGGKWRAMRVIEEEVPPPHIAPHPAVPPTEVE